MNELEQIAKRANTELQNEAGFINCNVLDDLSGLSYNFDTEANASNYLFRRQLADVKFRMSVVGSSLIELR